MDGPIETSSISTMMPKFCRVRLIIVVLPLMSPAPGLPVSRSSSDKGGASKVFDRRRVSLLTSAPKPVSSGSVLVPKGDPWESEFKGSPLIFSTLPRGIDRGVSLIIIGKFSFFFLDHHALTG